MSNFIKKILISFLILFWIFWVSSVEASWSDYINIRYGSGWWWVNSSQEAPKTVSGWLPGSKIEKWDVLKIFKKFLTIFIEIVWVLAVFALIFSWIMYVLSGWEEEKAKRAKLWILWSLVAVLISASSWWIISFLNNVILK